MRLSVEDQNNPELADLCRRAIIVFKGKVIKHVIEADEEHGHVIVHKLDENGKFIIKDDEVEIVRWHGRVRIIDPLNTDLAGIYLK